MSRALTDHIASSFREDAPRPPVPGEEGDAPCYPGKVATMRPLDTAKSIFLKSFGSSARRNEDGLGEPEGSASPDSPPSRWTKSLHSLLGDQDGALLFRTFLEREKFVDTLDFWFACNGFRQMDLKDNKTQRVAKAIYKRYIENNGIVAKQLKPATKTFIRDNLKKIDSAMFDQAQTEIQITMEDTSYQMFLTSDIYLEYVRTGGENPSHVNPNGLCDLKVVCGYLPTLNEEEEWSCDFKAKTLVGLSSKALRATVSMRAVEAMDKAYGPRMYPYHVGSRAPAASTNDSEVSSDALTDDAMSVTDSVDGIPPYKMGSKKQLQREVQRNLRMNSQVSLPSFPCTRRPPKEMVPVEPTEFAAQLISRLQRLKKEQDTRSSLEERLQQIQEEEEREDAAETPGSAPHPLALLPGSSEDDPQAILDEHLSRVLKTPGCQSPTVLRHSPPSRSPERRVAAFRGASTRRALLSPGTSGALALGPSLGPLALVSRQSTKYIHHHYIHHHHTGPKSKEQIEREAALRVQGLCSGAGECQPCVPYQRSRSLGREKCGAAAVELNNSGRSSSLSRHTCHSGAEDGVAEGCPEESAPLLHLPADTADRSQNVWQWMLESERQGRHRSHSSTQITKKSFGGGQTHTWGGGGSSSHLRNHQPAHPFIQDPAMPPLPPPNTLAQLEEARRRLQEVSTKPPKQRHSMSSPQRDKSHLVPVQSGGGVAVASPNPITASPLVPGSVVQSEETKEDRKCSVSPGAAAPCSGETVVTYFFCGEEIPYRRSMKSHRLTLGHFKEQLRKKGNYRYYFKKASDEFECGAVFEEVSDDGSLLPTYEGKILGKVERME